jgi:hypothetical protein
VIKYPSGGRIFIALSATALPNGNISITVRRLEFSNAVSTSKRQIASIKGGRFDLAPGQSYSSKQTHREKTGKRKASFSSFALRRESKVDLPRGVLPEGGHPTILKRSSIREQLGKR